MNHASRRVLVLAVLGALVVLAAVVLVPRVLDDRSAQRATERADLEDDVPADLREVEAYDVGSTEHVDGGVEYDQTPPVGGEHHPAWWECGVYEEPVTDEHVVHSLEHGTVWITYDPDAGLSADDLGLLEAELPEKGIMSPYPGQSEPIIVSVWGRRLVLDGADDPRLALFVAEYGDGHTSPEAFASCAGGVTASQVEGAAA